MRGYVEWLERQQFQFGEDADISPEAFMEDLRTRLDETLTRRRSQCSPELPPERS